MTIHPISRFLVSTDKVCDYLPVLSTVTNIVDLFFKCVVLSLKSQASIQSSHYYTHLSQKTFKRCIVLLIPLVGQLAVALYDWKHAPRTAPTGPSLSTKPSTPPPELPDLILPPAAPAERKKYREFYRHETAALQAVQKKAENLLVVADRLKTQDFLAKAIWNNPKASEYLPDSFKGDEYLCSLTVKKQVLGALKCFDLTKNAILRMIEIEPDLDLIYLNTKPFYQKLNLLDDESFVLDALQRNSKQAFSLATSRVREIKALALQAIYTDIILANYVPGGLLLDEEVKAAIACRKQTH